MFLTAPNAHELKDSYAAMFWCHTQSQINYTL